MRCDSVACGMPSQMQSAMPAGSGQVTEDATRYDPYNVKSESKND